MKEKILIFILPLLCAILAIFSFIKLQDFNTDSIKFKDEYEKLNGVKAYGNTYQTLDIASNNPIKYSNYDEILDIIENKTGIIYLGFPKCPWCRTALPVLLDAAKENNIETIYYMDILNERDSYIYKDGKLVYDKDEEGNEKKGTKGYFKLLKALDSHLSDYVISHEGKSYEVGEKRIYAPSVIFVKDGNILGIHVSTVESQTNPFEALDKDQYEELYSIYESYILKLYNNSCDLDTAC